MSTAIATRSENGVSMQASELDRLLKNLIMKGATDDQIRLMLAICDLYGFSPLLKHVVLISGSVYVTRDGLLHVAHASGQFDGMETEATQDENGQWIATCRVWRKDMSRPFVYSARQAEHENKQSSAWRQSPCAMTIKSSEVMTFRRAFDISLGAAEEIGYDGKTSRLGDVIDVTSAPSGAAPLSPSRAAVAGALAAPQPAPTAPPPKRKKAMTPEETISFIRDATEPLERRQKAIGYLFGQAGDAELLNAYYATIIQYADSKEGLAHGGAALATAATEAFHARWEELHPDEATPADAIDVDAVEAVPVGA